MSEASPGELDYKALTLRLHMSLPEQEGIVRGLDPDDPSKVRPIIKDYILFLQLWNGIYVFDR